MPQLEDDPEHPGRALYAWVRWFLDRLLVQSKAGPLGKLMAREMFQPTPAFDEVIRCSFLPMKSALGRSASSSSAGDSFASGDPTRFLRLEIHPFDRHHGQRKFETKG